MLNAVIIEDELSSRNNLKNLLKLSCKNVQVTGEGGTIKEALGLLSDPEEQPDILFLDINLTDGLAFRLLDQLPEIRFEIIFVTAYEKFAKTACNYASIGYIDKPIDPDNLVAAVGRVIRAQQRGGTKKYEMFKQQYFEVNPINKVRVSSGNKIYLVDIKDIMFMKANDNLTQFCLKDGRKIWCAKTIGSYAYLTSCNFFRIHKNCMVNLNYVDAYVREGYVEMVSQEKLTVSKRKRTELIEKIDAMQSR